MTQDASNVYAASPVVAGGIAVAPIGTALPTDATTALDAAFVRLGYVSEDGVEPAGDSASLTDIIAWGGDAVASLVETKSIERYEFTLIEVTSQIVAEYLYGAANVTFTAAGVGTNSTLDIVDSAQEPDDVSLVFDTMYKGKRARIVLPNATSVIQGRNPLVHTDLMGYQVQVTALPDGSGNRQYLYFENDDAL